MVHVMDGCEYEFIILFVQAEVEGQTITWLTPHSLQQVVSDDVDIATLLNFLQLYEVGNMFIFSAFIFFDNSLIFMSSYLIRLQI